MENTILDDKINKVFAGCVVRKDLVKEVKGNAIVPSYVLEYLLGQYCATNDENTIAAGIESVKNILAKHYVHRNKAGYIKAKIKEQGRFKVIDQVSVELDEKNDRYLASFSNLGINKVFVDPTTAYKKFPRLLSTEVWCLVDLEWNYSEEAKETPYNIVSIKPIQLAQFDFEDFKAKRAEFTTDEWIDLLIRSIGFNPEFLSKRKKMLQLVRLIPYCERNYNFIELGPKGTGKTHIYTDFSPHGTLISGSEVSAAKLFVNNSRKHDIGLVGYWDNIAFDEFAGKKKKIDDAFVDIMQNYMANKTFSRGSGKLSAEASMSFVGNTSHNVPYMLKNATLFDDIPPAYKKSAFLDRLWFYLPGWEVDITRGELFTKDYGFIVDYYSEALKSLRDYDYSNEYKNYFTLSSTLSERDRDGVTKTFSGLMKIIFPDKNATEDEIAEILKFAIEGRKRVKDQIMRIDTTFPEVDFEFENKSGEIIKVKTTEEMQYPNLYYGKSNDEYTDPPETVEIQEEQEETNIEDNTETKKQTEEFKEKHFVIEENQCGVTYEKLFAPIFKSAKHIEIIDPYIRNFFQTLNLMELLEVIEKYKLETDVVQVDLITSVDEFNEQTQNENLETIRESCFQMGIEFNFKYDTTIHARSITTDNGWKVLLDRGLDIYQNCERKDVFQFTTRIQKFRPCKRFEITYLRNNEA